MRLRKERRLAWEIAPVGSVVETFAKGMRAKSSFDAAAALSRAKQGDSDPAEGLTSPRARGKAMKVPRLQAPPEVAGN